MTRQRLRPAHPQYILGALYAKPHDHTRWPDHIIRVATTAGLARKFAGPVASAADLSCGSGAILAALEAEQRIYGDYAPGYDYQGPIEETIEQIPNVDLFVCCETLEHLDDPDAVLTKIRQKARMLVLSTPVDAWGDTNLEHYWAWSRADVEKMLVDAGWQVDEYVELDFRPEGLVYCFGVWGAR